MSQADVAIGPDAIVVRPPVPNRIRHGADLPRIDGVLRVEMDLTYNAAHGIGCSGFVSRMLSRDTVFEDKLIAAVMAAAGLKFSQAEALITVEMEDVLRCSHLKGIAANPIPDVDKH